MLFAGAVLISFSRFSQSHMSWRLSSASVCLFSGWFLTLKPLILDHSPDRGHVIRGNRSRCLKGLQIVCLSRALHRIPAVFSDSLHSDASEPCRFSPELPVVHYGNTMEEEKFSVSQPLLLFFMSTGIVVQTNYLLFLTKHAEIPKHGFTVALWPATQSCFIVVMHVTMRKLDQSVILRGDSAPIDVKNRLKHHSFPKKRSHCVTLEHLSYRIQ